MSLVTNLQNAFTRVGTEFKSIRTLIGDPATLTTVAKTFVGAINEVNAKPTGSGGAPINDGAASASSTYSSNKTESRLGEVAAATKADILGGAAAAYDTLQELKAYADSGQAADQTALANRLRLDGTQTLTAGQKAQGQSNLGVYGTDAIGDPATNFVSAFETALA